MSKVKERAVNFIGKLPDNQVDALMNLIIQFTQKNTDECGHPLIWDDEYGFIPEIDIKEFSNWKEVQKDINKQNNDRSAIFNDANKALEHLKSLRA
jgi:transposase